MTLSTEVRTLVWTDPAELHDWVNENLLLAPNATKTVQDGEICNEPGQGLNAWLITTYDADGVLNSGYDASLGDEDYDEDDAEYYSKVPAGFVNLDFDTAYGFQYNGMGCGDLHAAYIVALAKGFFEPRKIPFVWHNEFRDEWFTGLDGLETLGRGGAEAAAWFTNTVKPAIKAEAASKGVQVFWE